MLPPHGVWVTEARGEGDIRRGQDGAVEDS